MSSQTFPPQGVGGTATTNPPTGSVTAAMTVKPNATPIAKVTNNGKDIIKMDGGIGSGGARTQLLADKQEGPRVVVQPAYPPMSMPKHFSPSPPSTAVPPVGKVMNTSIKMTAASNTISTSSGIKTACYIIPATKGPQASDISKATMVTKVTAKQHIPISRSLLTTKTNPPVTTIMQPATQKIVAPVRLPMVTTSVASAAGDPNHPNTMVTGLVTTTPSAHIKTTIHGLPTAASQAGVQLPQGVLATMPFVKGVHQHQTMQSQTVASAFASHLPKGAAVAAAMTAPRAGMTTALRATVPIGSSQVTSTPPTIIPPSILHTQMQRLPSQVHLSAQVHMPNRVHSPASGISQASTVIPRAPSPAVTLATHAQPEPHRTATHAAALKSLAVSAAQARSEVNPHAARSDLKHDVKYTTEANLKVDSRAEVRTGTRGPEVRHQGGRVEVRTIDPKTDRTVGKLDPRTDIRSGYTYQLNTLNAAQKQHPYMASLNVPRQQLQGAATSLVSGTTTHGLMHSMTSVGGVTSVSNTPVTTQSTNTAVVRTTSVTATTNSTSHPTSSSSNIPVAKVYPRQQHTTRVTTEPSPTAVYLPPPPHRNSQPNVAAVTSVSGLTTSVSMSSGDHARTATAGVQQQHQAIPPGHYPAAAMPYYFSPELAPYQHMLRYNQHGPLATMPNTMVRPTIDPHTRLPVHPTAANQSSSSVAAAIATAAAAAANTPPVRLSHHGPLTMMIEPRGRQVAMQNCVTSTTEGSAVASALFLTSMAGGVYSAGQTTLNSMAAVAASQQQQHQQQQQTTMANPAASPRPSILQRKRQTDSNAIRKATLATSSSQQPNSPGPKLDLLRAAAHSPKAPDSLSSSQHSVDSNMSSEISTDTVHTPSSAGSLRIKQEPDVSSSTQGGAEGAPQVTISTTGVTGLNSSTPVVEEVMGPSPRKKPRKQQHIVATEHPDILDDQSTDEETETKPRPPFRLKKERKERKLHHHRHQDTESLKIVHYFRRPCCRLLDTYRQTWKPTHNHFDRYTDVKPKEDKRISIHEIANQRGVLKKTDGWKIRHISYQFEDLGNLEKDVHDQMDEIKDGLAEYQAQEDNKDTTQIYELMQGNIQRSKYVMEHLTEAKSTMLKLLEHKPKVLNIIKKHANKRHAKKKSHSS